MSISAIMNLQKFYPEEMEIAQILQRGKGISVKIFARSKAAKAAREYAVP